MKCRRKSTNIQEFRTEKAVTASARLAAPRARVIRGGHAFEGAASDVMAGDVLVLEAGDLVAADPHLIEASAFKERFT